MSSSSISASLRLFTTKFPNPLLSHKTFISPKPHSLSFFKTISFQKLPTTPSSPSLSAAAASASSSLPLQPIEELPPKLQEIVNLFQSVQEPKAKYEQLLFYGKNLKPLGTQFKTKENKVEGCVSQVWVRAYLDSDKNVVFEADSDSVLTKGLAALLVNGLSGRPVEEILRVSPDFAMLLGLQQSLTPSRNNGFLNMLRLMQKKALQLAVEAEKGKLSMSEKVDGGIESVNFESNPDVGVEENPVGISDSLSQMDGSAENGNFGSNSNARVEESPVQSSNSDSLGSRGVRIKEKLERELSPVELEVEDISYQHAGHAGARGSDGETHFNVKVVSKEFEGKSLVKRHRLVYGLLQEELQSGLHALSIVAKTPSEV
ncbi:sufE-like protein 1, chloroplastic/mitochondrial [Corylus avellana]|uniref:sufE-like protein 1, chloroplastic/mitochondrial n=1 Tax=Corylus avellana TaxID=13451 RepID=UPI001E20B408|nr:sufE-like protein 1, chloroplastic/mitochondrial [Corylus avellana]